MSDYFFTAKNKQTGEVIHVTALDDHFGKHKYGYKTGNRILTEEEFDLAYDRVEDTVPTYSQGGSSVTVHMEKELTNDFTAPVEPWEVEFDELIVFQTYEIPKIVKNDIKDFIRSTLTNQRTALVEMVKANKHEAIGVNGIRTEVVDVDTIINKL